MTMNDKEYKLQDVAASLPRNGDTEDADEDFYLLSHEALQLEPTWQDVLLNYSTSTLIAIGIGCAMLLILNIMICSICCHYRSLKKRQEEKLLQAATNVTERDVKAAPKTLLSHYRRRPEPEEHTDTMETGTTSQTSTETDEESLRMTQRLGLPAPTGFSWYGQHSDPEYYPQYYGVPSFEPVASAKFYPSSCSPFDEAPPTNSYYPDNTHSTEARPHGDLSPPYHRYLPTVNYHPIPLHLCRGEESLTPYQATSPRPPQSACASAALYEPYPIASEASRFSQPLLSPEDRKTSGILRRGSCPPTLPHKFIRDVEPGRLSATNTVTHQNGPHPVSVSGSPQSLPRPEYLPTSRFPPHTYKRQSAPALFATARSEHESVAEQKKNVRHFPTPTDSSPQCETEEQYAARVSFALKKDSDKCPPETTGRPLQTVNDAPVILANQQSGNEQLAWPSTKDQKHEVYGTGVEQDARNYIRDFVSPQHAEDPRFTHNRFLDSQMSTASVPKNAQHSSPSSAPPAPTCSKADTPPSVTLISRAVGTTETPASCHTADQAPQYSYEVSMGGFERYPTAKDIPVDEGGCSVNSSINNQTVRLAHTQPPTVHSARLSPVVEDGRENTRTEEDFSNSFNLETPRQCYANSHNASMGASEDSATACTDYDSLHAIQFQNPVSDSMTVHVGKSRTDQYKKYLQSLGIPNKTKKRHSGYRSDSPTTRGEELYLDNSQSPSTIHRKSKEIQNRTVADSELSGKSNVSKCTTPNIKSRRKSSDNSKRGSMAFTERFNQRKAEYSVRMHKAEQSESCTSNVFELRHPFSSRARVNSAVSFLMHRPQSGCNPSNTPGRTTGHAGQRGRTSTPVSRHSSLSNGSLLNGISQKKRDCDISKVQHKHHYPFCPTSGQRSKSVKPQSATDRLPRRSPHFHIDEERVATVHKKYGQLAKTYSKVPVPSYPYYPYPSPPSPEQKVLKVTEILDTHEQSHEEHVSGNEERVSTMRRQYGKLANTYNKVPVLSYPYYPYPSPQSPKQRELKVKEILDTREQSHEEHVSGDEERVSTVHKKYGKRAKIYSNVPVPRYSDYPHPPPKRNKLREKTILDTHEQSHREHVSGDEDKVSTVHTMYGQLAKTVPSYPASYPYSPPPSPKQRKSKVKEMPDTHEQSYAEHVLGEGQCSVQGPQKTTKLPFSQYFHGSCASPSSPPCKKIAAGQGKLHSHDDEWDYRHPMERKVSGLRRTYSNRSHFHKHSPASVTAHYNVTSVSPESPPHKKQSQDLEEDVLEHSPEWDYKNPGYNKHPPVRRVNSLRKAFSFQAESSHKVPLPVYPYTPRSPSPSPQSSHSLTATQNNIPVDSEWDYRHPHERKVSRLHNTFSNESRKHRHTFSSPSPPRKQRMKHSVNAAPNDPDCSCENTPKSKKAEPVNCHSKRSKQSTPPEHHHYPCSPSKSPPAKNRFWSTSPLMVSDSHYDTKHPPPMKASGLRRTYSNQSKKFNRTPFPECPHYPCSPKKSVQIHATTATSKCECGCENPLSGKVSLLRRMYSNHCVKIQPRRFTKQHCHQCSPPPCPPQTEQTVGFNICDAHPEHIHPESQASWMANKFTRRSLIDQRLPFPGYPYLPCPHSPSSHQQVDKTAAHRSRTHHIHGTHDCQHLRGLRERELFQVVSKEPQFTYSCTEIDHTSPRPGHPDGHPTTRHYPAWSAVHDSSPHLAQGFNKQLQRHRYPHCPPVHASPRPRKQDFNRATQYYPSSPPALDISPPVTNKGQLRNRANQYLTCPCPHCPSPERSHYIGSARMYATQDMEASPNKESTLRKYGGREASDYGKLPFPKYPYYPRRSPPSPPKLSCVEDTEFCLSDSEWDYRNPPERKVSSLRRHFTSRSRGSTRTTMPQPHHRSSSRQFHRSSSVAASKHSVADVTEDETPTLSMTEKLFRRKASQPSRDTVTALRKTLLEQGVKLSGRLAPVPPDSSHFLPWKSHNRDTSPTDSVNQSNIAVHKKRKSMRKRLSEDLSKGSETDTQFMPTDADGYSPAADVSPPPSRRVSQELAGPAHSSRRRSSDRQSRLSRQYSKDIGLTDSRRHSRRESVHGEDLTDSRRHSHRESVHGEDLTDSRRHSHRESVHGEDLTDSRRHSRREVVHDEDLTESRRHSYTGDLDVARKHSRRESVHGEDLTESRKHSYTREPAIYRRHSHRESSQNEDLADNRKHSYTGDLDVDRRHSRRESAKDEDLTDSRKDSYTGDLDVARRHSHRESVKHEDLTDPRKHSYTGEPAGYRRHSHRESVKHEDLADSRKDSYTGDLDVDRRHSHRESVRDEDLADIRKHSYTGDLDVARRHSHRESVKHEDLTESRKDSYTGDLDVARRHSHRESVKDEDLADPRKDSYTGEPGDARRHSRRESSQKEDLADNRKHSYTGDFDVARTHSRRESVKDEDLPDRKLSYTGEPAGYRRHSRRASVGSQRHSTDENILTRKMSNGAEHINTGKRSKEREPGFPPRNSLLVSGDQDYDPPQRWSDEDIPFPGKESGARKQSTNGRQSDKRNSTVLRRQSTEAEPGMRERYSNEELAMQNEQFDERRVSKEHPSDVWNHESEHFTEPPQCNAERRNTTSRRYSDAGRTEHTERRAMNEEPVLSPKRSVEKDLGMRRHSHRGQTKEPRRHSLEMTRRQSDNMEDMWLRKKSKDGEPIRAYSEESDYYITQKQSNREFVDAGRRSGETERDAFRRQSNECKPVASQRYSDLNLGVGGTRTSIVPQRLKNETEQESSQGFPTEGELLAPHRQGNHIDNGAIGRHSSDRKHLTERRQSGRKQVIELKPLVSQRRSDDTSHDVPRRHSIRERPLDATILSEDYGVAETNLRSEHVGHRTHSHEQTPGEAQRRSTHETAVNSRESDPGVSHKHSDEGPTFTRVRSHTDELAVSRNRSTKGEPAMSRTRSIETDRRVSADGNAGSRGQSNEDHGQCRRPSYPDQPYLTQRGSNAGGMDSSATDNDLAGSRKYLRKESLSMKPSDAGMEETSRRHSNRRGSDIRKHCNDEVSGSGML